MASRVIISGNVVEIYEYEDGCLYDYEVPPKSAISLTGEWHGKREDNLRRARATLRRVIWSNLDTYSKFLTLTYAENVQDVDRFRKDWHNFVQSLSRKGIRLQYLYVLEYQKRGAIHAHVVIFNNEKIPLAAVENAWGHGFVKLNRIRDVRNLGAYVCKYLTKETMAAYGSHSFFCSIGLNRPQEIKIDLDSMAAVEAYKQGITTTYTNTYSIPKYDSEGNVTSYKAVKYTQGKRV